MAVKKQVNDALQKLDWISKLSRETCPQGVPDDPERVRLLLNRIVKDVRAACRVLSDLSDSSDLSDKKANRKEKPGLIPTYGGYRKLKSFQVAEVVYDGTKIFCDRFIDKRSRTHDQMVQAARSGRQNTAEGSMASATSKKTELKLTNVAKASLEELLLDYEDFLRQHGKRQWHKNDPEALAVRGKYRSFPDKWFENIVIIPRAHVFGASSAQGESGRSDKSDKSDRSDGSDRALKKDRQGAGELHEKPESDRLDPYGVAKAPPEVAANILICLVNQAIFLLKHQLERLEKDFVEQGGFTERLYRVRSERRRLQ